MNDFDTLWRWINNRGSVITVQERSELEHVYNLMRDCGCFDYLEVGTAEGNSLFVLGHVVSGGINYIDLGEAHTAEPRNQAVLELQKNNNTPVTSWLGDSTNPDTFPKSYPSLNATKSFDCVLIDGGHDFATVLSDAILYAPLATKYVFFHDIQLPEVRAAVEWFVKRWKLGTYSTFISSQSFGYGIIKIER